MISLKSTNDFDQARPQFIWHKININKDQHSVCSLN